jgi:hypothetical protein
MNRRDVIASRIRVADVLDDLRFDERHHRKIRFGACLNEVETWSSGCRFDVAKCGDDGRFSHAPQAITLFFRFGVP